MPRGHRHMYYLTGLPGWMRFGYSPGWGGAPSSYPGFQPSQEPMMNQEQELEMLKNQAQFLKQQMDYIDARIREMEKES